MPRWLLITFSLVLGAVLLTTRIGVFIVFDVLGDLGDGKVTGARQATAGPLRLDAELTGTRLALPAEIEQASGIVVAADSVWITTDQAELFHLDKKLQLIRPQWQLLNGPLLLRQGKVEAVEANFLGDGSWEITVAGELGELARYSLINQQPQTLLPLPALPLSSAPLGTAFEFEVTGLTRTPSGLLLSQSGDARAYSFTTAEFINHCDTQLLLPGRELSELSIAGIAYQPDTQILWMVTGFYPALLALELNAQELCIRHAFGIDAGEPSDLAIHNGQAWVTADHNLFDDRPPIFVYDLPNLQ